MRAVEISGIRLGEINHEITKALLILRVLGALDG